MSSAARLPVVPTVTVLAAIKTRLLAAVKGHALLKKKADALSMRFRQVLKKIMQSKLAVGGSMKAAAFALTEAKYAAGDFRHTVQDAVSSASVRVRAATDNVAGVRVPRFERAPPPATAAPRADLTGLGAGGAQVAGARAAFLDAVALVVELASLQAAFASLDAAIKTTNRRVNALDNVVRPRLEATIAYIKGELDELEREDFFRLKKVQGKKKRDADAAAALRKAAAAPGGGSVATPAAPRSVLGPARDEEVVL